MKILEKIDQNGTDYTEPQSDMSKTEEKAARNDIKRNFWQQAEPTKRVISQGDKNGVCKRLPALKHLWGVGASGMRILMLYFGIIGKES